MKDLFIQEWVHSWHSLTDAVLHGLPSSVKTQPLGPVVRAFVDNVNQTAKLAFFPHQLFMTGRRMQLAKAAACWELLQKPYFDEDDYPRLSQIERRAREFFDGTATPPFLVGVAGLVDEANQYLHASHQRVFRTLMTTQVVMTWTAFETLAEDLWVAAVNCHPQGLAQLSGRRKKQQEATDGSNPKTKQAEGKGDQGRMMPFSVLEQHHFNVGSVMGDIQRHLRKVDFTSLDMIRNAYVAAFADELPAAYQILDEDVFYHLSIVRNVIIHSAGKCDEEYKSKSKDRPIPQLKLGEELQLNGALMCDLTAPVIIGCMRLIQAVDQWLSSESLPPGDGAGI